MEFSGNYAKRLNDFRGTDIFCRKNLCHPTNKTLEFSLLKNSSAYDATRRVTENCISVKAYGAFSLGNLRSFVFFHDLHQHACSSEAR